MRFEELTVHVTALDDTGLFIAQSDQVPDLTGAGHSADEAIEDLRRLFQGGVRQRNARSGGPST